jgi:hypothetical protein
MSLTTSIFVAGRGAGAVGAKTVPSPIIPVPPEPNDAVEAPQRLVEISPQDPSRHFVLEADNSPDPVKKAEPRKAG